MFHYIDAMIFVNKCLLYYFVICFLAIIDIKLFRDNDIDLGLPTRTICKLCGFVLLVEQMDFFLLQMIDSVYDSLLINDSILVIFLRSDKLPRDGKLVVRSSMYLAT